MNTIEQETNKLASALSKYLDQPDVPKMAFALILLPINIDADCECVSNISRDDLRKMLKVLLSRIDCQPEQVGHA